MIDGGLNYYTVERPFIDYFDRLHAIGKSFFDISAMLPSMYKYYDEMVVCKVNVGYFYAPNLDDLFSDWKSNRW